MIHKILPLFVSCAFFSAGFSMSDNSKDNIELIPVFKSTSKLQISLSEYYNLSDYSEEIDSDYSKEMLNRVYTLLGTTMKNKTHFQEVVLLDNTLLKEDIIDAETANKMHCNDLTEDQKQLKPYVNYKYAYPDIDPAYGVSYLDTPSFHVLNNMFSVYNKDEHGNKQTSLTSSLNINGYKLPASDSVNTILFYIAKLVPKTCIIMSEFLVAFPFILKAEDAGSPSSTPSKSAPSCNTDPGATPSKNSCDNLSQQSISTSENTPTSLSQKDLLGSIVLRAGKLFYNMRDAYALENGVDAIELKKGEHRLPSHQGEYGTIELKQDLKISAQDKLDTIMFAITKSLGYATVDCFVEFGPKFIINKFTKLKHQYCKFIN